MTNKKTVVLGIYPTREAVERGVNQLKSSGFRNADVSALLPTVESTKEFAHEMKTKSPEGTTVGAASGAILGGTLGWLAGIGAIAIPGVGPFIAAGPIMGMLAGAGVGGAVGGITGALIGLGFPEYEAKRYEGRVKKGGILLSVHCDDDDWEAKARDVLTSTGAEDISATTEADSDNDESEKPHLMSDNY